MEKLSGILRKIYTAIFALMAGILTVMSALRSSYFDADRDIETPIYKWDLPLLLIGVYLILLAVLAKAGKYKAPKAEKAGIAAAFVSLFLSLGFLVILQSKPYMDCSALVEIASAFNKGDFSALNSPTGDTYLYIYPFQIGYIVYLQIIFRIFGDGNYFAVQVINAFFAAWMVWSIFKIAGELSAAKTETAAKKEPADGTAFFAAEDEKNQFQFITAVLLVFCLPLFIDVTFVYGDVPGWAFGTAAFYCVLHWVHNRSRYRYLIFAAMLLTCGYMLKTNIAVFIVAAVIVIFLECLRNRQWKPFLLALMCVVLPVLVNSGVKEGYAKVAGVDEFPPGTPSTCWIAMGMIESNDFENGWYNGYNIQTFEESGYNTEIADEMAKATIRERISLFAHHPGYAAKFYLRKFVSAWNDPEFDSQIKMNWGTRRNERISPIAKWLIWGNGGNILYWIMNILHFIIFASCFAEVVRALRKRDDLSRMISYSILLPFGGMLFHLLWETQARYMIGYYCMLFPAAGDGLVHLSSEWKRAAEKRNRKISRSETK